MPDLDYAQEIAGCRALLLEIIRRAAYDWVLYRNSTRLKQKKLAQEAHCWLFLEGPGHPDWIIRDKTNTQFTAFLNICSELDLDPEMVRTRAREITIQEILSVGRPPTYRRAQPDEDEDAVSADTFSVPGVIEQDDTWGGGSYE